ncbi:CYTH domain-containing protein [Clostridium yunnanense]|uniref:CYTH domain-containing protein n=1 Tax=Clostridium yunnanense TaxID=2800325 RepID=UPI001A9C3601|nr:CYTH domain-containing protein [Clostridium yunnanense]
MKYILNKDNFHKFKEFLEDRYIKKDSFNQINYYIDNKFLELNSRAIRLRIRDVLNDRIELTLKSPIAHNEIMAHAHIKMEETIELTHVNMENLIEHGIHCNKEIVEFIDNRLNEVIDIKSLTIIGQLETNRTNYSIDDIDDLISLDISNYLGKEDYEVEWECSDLTFCNGVLLNFFRELEINYEKDKTSKTSRFLRRLNKLKDMEDIIT